MIEYCSVVVTAAASLLAVKPNVSSGDRKAGTGTCCLQSKHECVLFIINSAVDAAHISSLYRRTATFFFKMLTFGFG